MVCKNLFKYDKTTSSKVFCLFSGMMNFIVIGILYILIGIITKPVAYEMNCTEGFVSFWGGIQVGVMSGIGPIASALLRRFGMRTLGSVTGFVSFCVQLFLSTGATNKWMFVIAVCLQGICIGMLQTATFVVAAQVFTTRLSQVNAVLLATGVLAMGLAPLIQKLVDYYGWRGAIALIAAAHLHVSVGSFLLHPSVGKFKLDPEDTEETVLLNRFENNRGFVKKILEHIHLNVFSNNRQLLALSMSAVIGGFTMSAFNLFLISYAVNSGISPIDASKFMFTPVVFCISVRIVLFFGEIDASLLTEILAVAQLFELTSFFIIASGQTLMMFHIGSAFHGLAYGILWHAYVTLATMFVRNTNEKDKAISWIMFADGVGSISTAIVGFYISSYRVGFYIGCCIQIIAVILVVYMIILQKGKPTA